MRQIDEEENGEARSATLKNTGKLSSSPDIKNKGRRRKSDLNKLNQYMGSMNLHEIAEESLDAPSRLTKA